MSISLSSVSRPFAHEPNKNALLKQTIESILLSRMSELNPVKSLAAAGGAIAGAVSKAVKDDKEEPGDKSEEDTPEEKPEIQKTENEETEEEKEDK